MNIASIAGNLFAATPNKRISAVTLLDPDLFDSETTYLCFLMFRFGLGAKGK